MQRVGTKRKHSDEEDEEEGEDVERILKSSKDNSLTLLPDTEKK